MKNEWIFFLFASAVVFLLLLLLLLLCHHRVFVESRLCGKLSCEWNRREEQSGGIGRVGRDEHRAYISNCVVVVVFFFGGDAEA
jgi:hypothetical protein